MTDKQMARVLGVVSIGLGLMEVAAPGWLGRRIGVRDNHTLLRALGAREMLTGVGILAERRPTTGLWARVAGDAMDLTLLGVAAKNSWQRRRVGFALGLVLAITALDAFSARKLQRHYSRRHAFGLAA
ncbi:MAG TPA: hypothetical protein VF166_05345 [Gemmatimonadaceae bacterium]